MTMCFIFPMKKKFNMDGSYGFSFHDTMIILFRIQRLKPIKIHQWENEWPKIYKINFSRNK